MSKAAELAALIGSQTALSNRNLIDNGAMNIFQRSTSATGITSENYYAADRFKVNMSDAGTHTMSQSSTVPSGQGFNNSLKLDCTTADASVAAGSYMSIDHRIEAQNLQRLNWGTSSAKNLTISFWVRSNLTGTYVLEYLHADASVYNSNTYTIDAADTWEKKTITISGYTPTAINDDTGIGLYVFWWLQSGSTYGGGTTTNDTWHTTQANRAGGLSVDFGTSTDNEFYLTGVQLEVGDVATPFEHRSFGDELARCQRYYQRIESNGTYDALLDGMHHVTTQFYAMHTFPVQMRAEPTMAGSGTFSVLSNGSDRTPDSLILNRATKEVIQTYCALSGGNVGTAGHGGHIRNNNDASTFLEFIAEL